MEFAPFNVEAATFAADLVNTKGSTSGQEFLADLEAWKSFLMRYGIEGAAKIKEADVDEIKRYRERIRQVFAVDEETAIKLLNELLQESATTPQVTDHDGLGWHMHYSGPSAPLPRRIASAAAMGLALLISEQGFDRLGICAATDCSDVFVDTSRNRSRRFCNELCSTRTHVAAHRERRRRGVS
jgi:predicted RNA-binding Zn ribbon-like protein